jgi:hypothetical protein
MNNYKDLHFFSYNVDFSALHTYSLWVVYQAIQMAALTTRGIACIHLVKILYSQLPVDVWRPIDCFDYMHVQMTLLSKIDIFLVLKQSLYKVHISNTL